MTTSLALCAVAAVAIVSSIWTRGDKSFGLWLLALFAIAWASSQ